MPQVPGLPRDIRCIFRDGLLPEEEDWLSFSVGEGQKVPLDPVGARFPEIDKVHRFLGMHSRRGIADGIRPLRGINREPGG